MKTRLIKGLSKVPERLGNLLPKIMGVGDPGTFPVVCNVCTNSTNFKPIKNTEWFANVCEHCHNCRIILNEYQRTLLRSAIRLENFSATLAKNWHDEQVEALLKKICVNQRYISYLGLARSRTQKTINGNVVSTHAYYIMCRYVLFNIIPHDVQAMSIFTENMVNVEGQRFLLSSPEYYRVFGQTPHSTFLSQDDYFYTFSGQSQIVDQTVFMETVRRVLEIYAPDTFRRREGS